jgi:hypothetical protein
MNRPTTVATGLIFGIVPALESTRPDIAETLKQETRNAGRILEGETFGPRCRFARPSIPLPEDRLRQASRSSSPPWARTRFHQLRRRINAADVFNNGEFFRDVTWRGIK